MKSMTKTDWVKQGIGLVIGIGVSQIIYGIVNENVDDERIDRKATVFIGKHAISLAAKEIVQSRVDDAVDRIIVWHKKNDELIKALLAE